MFSFWEYFCILDSNALKFVHKIPVDGKSALVQLTHWGRVTHICVGKLTIICSDNGLAPRRRQAIIWTNAGLLLIGPLGTNFSEILIEMLTFSFKKMRLKVSSGKCRPFCPGLNVLKAWCQADDKQLPQAMRSSSLMWDSSWQTICHHWFRWCLVLMITQYIDVYMTLNVYP